MLVYAQSPQANPMTAPAHYEFLQYANIIAEILNQLNSDQSTEADLIAYAQNIGISVKHFDKSQRELLGQFVQFEMETINRIDENVFAAAYNGDFGKSIRTLLQSELTDRAQQSAQINAMTMQMAGSVAMSGSAAYLAGTGKIAPSQNLVMQMNLMQSELAAFQLQDQNAKALAKLFNNQFNREFTAQSEFVINTSKGQHKITAKNLVEARAEFKKIWDEEMAGK